MDDWSAWPLPVTPFHFGPGILAKTLFPRHVSLTSFVAVEIAVDVEVLWNLWFRNWPLHGSLHSLVLSVPAGVVVGAVVWALPRLFRRAFRSVAQTDEFRLAPCLLAGGLGGVGASLLDALMHDDVAPFWPLASSNPFHGVIDVGVLHVVCFAAGVLGALALYCRATVGERRSTR